MSKSQVGLTKPSPSIGQSKFSSNGTTAVHLFIKRSSHNQRSKFYLSQREPESHEKGNGLWILCLSLIIVCTFRRVLFCLSLSLWTLAFRSEAIFDLHPWLRSGSWRSSRTSRKTLLPPAVLVPSSSPNTSSLVVLFFSTLLVFTVFFGFHGRKLLSWLDLWSF